MADEPDAAGARNYGGLGGGFNLKLPELDAAKDTVGQLHFALEGLRTALGKFNSFTASSLTNVLKSIQHEAQLATQAVYGVAGSFGGGGGGGGGGGTAFSGANYVAAASTQIASSVGRMPGGINGSQYFAGQGGAIGDLAMVIPNFIRERFTTNRNNSLQGAGAFSLLSRQQGVNPADIMGNLGNNGMPVMGTPSDMFSLFSMAPSLGASYNFNGRQGGQGVRARGFFTGVQQAQAMNPYQDVGSIATSIGGYAANTAAQQQSAFMTGGAMSIIGAGGRQKSLSEWAESILKWFMGLRTGSKKDKAFTYGDLMAQYFPGSNIDAWFTTNGVPQTMRDYWWTYALQKAGGTSGDTGGAEMKIGGDDKNLAFKRLQATNELTKTEFSLSGSMQGAYLNRETMNRWFNQFSGSMQKMAMPAIANALPFVQYMPDTIEDMLFSTATSGADLLGKFVANKVGAGDIGDYGDVGGTSTSGMHPDMKRKLGAMMQANPRLSVTSGLRDTNMQRRLKKRGFSNVSGKGSAHTRGMAADLGPSSEYGWIAANAGKFGLKSGRSKGEPWHVGMGDVGDPVSDALGGITGFDWSSLLGILGGGVKAGEGAGGDIAANMVGGITGLFNWMLGALGLSGKSTQGPAYQPDLYDSLFNSQAKGMARGLPVSTWSGTPNPAVSGGGTGSRSYSQAQGSLDDRGKQAAIVAHNAGFSGDALAQIVAIAGRESHFDPMAHRSTHVPKVPEFGDRGLWQINYKNDDALKRAGIISTASDLFKPEVNAAAAHFLYQQYGNTFKAWSAAPGVGWSSGGDPTFNTDLASARDIIHSAGLGDVDAMTYAASLPRGTSSGGGSMMQFNNTFQIGGGGSGAGAGGIDVRRTVTMIADQLEGEMKRRSARVN